MIYLIEVCAHDGVGEVTLRFGTAGYTTQPADDLPDTWFDPRVIQPGNYERYVFSQGSTSGDVRVGAGEIVLANPDGELDHLLDYAFDGYRLTVYALPDLDAPWSTRAVKFVGTVEQAEFSWRRIALRIRDRLVELREPIQPVTYAGTTITGGMVEAEGRPEDIKDSQKPLLYGVGCNLPAVAANIFDHVYEVASNGVASVEAVYDRGVALAFSATYPDLPALLAATIPSGQYAACLSPAYVRLGAKPDGQITIDATEGATLADRSASAVARRILEMHGFVAGVDFNAASFDALHAKNPAPIGLWTGATDMTILQALAMVLGSIGGHIAPDRLGVFHVGRVEAAAGEPVIVLDKAIILDRGTGIERIATNDAGAGVPAHKVSINYARNYARSDANRLSEAASAEFVAFASQEFRTVTAEDPAVKARHLLAPELTFETLLILTEDAQAEAVRQLSLYSSRRDLFRIHAKSELVADVDLAVTAQVTSERFGLAAGKLFLCTGLEEDLEMGITILEVYG